MMDRPEEKVIVKGEFMKICTRSTHNIVLRVRRNCDGTMVVRHFGMIDNKLALFPAQSVPGGCLQKFRLCNCQCSFEDADVEPKPTFKPNITLLLTIKRTRYHPHLERGAILRTIGPKRVQSGRTKATTLCGLPLCFGLC